VVTISGKRAVDALEPRDKPYIVFDGHLSGFGCRVMPSGAKSFILDYRPGAGGRSVAKRRLTLGRYGPMTVEQARKAAADALAKIRLGQDPQGDKARERASLTVGGLIDLFLEDHVSTKLKSKTQIDYAILLRKARAAYGGTKAEALRTQAVAALHRSMARTPFQANKVLDAISSLYSWGERHGYLPDGFPNPARKVGRYREQSRERFLTGEELGRLGDTLREAETVGLPYAVDEGNPKAKHATKDRRTVLDPFAVAAIRLLILTGARLREILHAKWDYIDFERAILFLPDSKTGRKPVFLSAPALEVLASLPRIEGNPFITPGAKEGQPRRDLKKPWASVIKAAGLDGLRLHDLRHSFASVGAGASLGLPVIGKLLGHSHAATTQRYAHLANDPVKEASECIGATISAALAGHKPEAPSLIRHGNEPGAGASN
jgi:integrase